MRIQAILEQSVRLQGSIANAVVNFSDHTVSLVALVSDQLRNGKPVVGIAFNSIGRFAQSGILRERMIPRVLEADPDSLRRSDGSGVDPAAIAATAMMNEKPGGHGDRATAAAALELAAWDLNAKLADEPAYAQIMRRLVGNTPDEDAPRPRTPVYAAGGYYYDGDSNARLSDEIKRYQDQGFQAFKIKIGGAALQTDLSRIETAVKVAGQPQSVAVDANGRFDLNTAIEYGRAIRPLGLRWYEEPGDPLDYALTAALAADYDGALATGENLLSAMDTKNLMQYAGLRPGRDILQMDPGLSYGLTEYLHVLAHAEAAGFSRQQCIPHGGHLINLHISTALGLGGCEAYPSVFQPFGGFAPECLLSEGYVAPSDAPGFGLEQKPELKALIKALME